MLRTDISIQAKINQTPPPLRSTETFFMRPSFSTAASCISAMRANLEYATAPDLMADIIQVKENYMLQIYNGQVRWWSYELNLRLQCTVDHMWLACGPHVMTPQQFLTTSHETWLLAKNLCDLIGLGLGTANQSTLLKQASKNYLPEDIHQAPLDHSCWCQFPSGYREALHQRLPHQSSADFRGKKEEV